MKIQTKYHGEIEIEEKAIVQFEEGIPSFDDEREFVILPFAEESPFHILQSIKSPSLGFVIASPFDFFEDYTVKLSDSTIGKLQIQSESEVVIFTILTIRDPFHETTANLRGPIVINTKEQVGKQIILNDETYTTKHNIIRTPAPVEEGK